jgi:hypothetical protein
LNLNQEERRDGFAASPRVWDCWYIKAPPIKMDSMGWHRKFHILFQNVLVSNKGLKLEEVFQAEYLHNISRRRFS